MNLLEADGIYKGFRIVQLGSFNLVEIKSIGQGPVPDALRGMFTTKPVAIKAIDFFVENREKEGGKTTGRSKG